jgi:hypothetical protein
MRASAGGQHGSDGLIPVTDVVLRDGQCPEDGGQGTCQLMSPRRSVIPYPELGQRARGEPVRIPLTGASQLDNPARDKFCLLIAGTGGKLKPRAGSIECLAHGFNMLGLESESTGSRFWHRGVTDVWSGAADVRLSELRRPALGRSIRGDKQSALSSSIYNEIATPKNISYFAAMYAPRRASIAERSRPAEVAGRNAAPLRSQRRCTRVAGDTPSIAQGG